MHLDFTNLNTTSPKDDFSLPLIDIFADKTAGQSPFI